MHSCPQGCVCCDGQLPELTRLQSPVASHSVSLGLPPGAAVVASPNLAQLYRCLVTGMSLLWTLITRGFIFVSSVSFTKSLIHTLKQ